MSSHVHTRAGAFDAAADAYERGRPGWPAAALDAVTERLGLSHGSAVLDLAAGTGKLTRDLVARFASVTAVEPLDGMRALLERAAPGARVLPGTSERIPLADGTVDAVLVAEAMHWFDLDRTLPELARVLEPGGGVAVLYNRLDWASLEHAWAAEVHTVFETHRLPEDDVDWAHTAPWREALTARFGPLVDATFENPQTIDVGALFSSFSMIAGLPPERRDAALAAHRDVLARHGVRTAELPYRTELTLAGAARHAAPAG